MHTINRLGIWMDHSIAHIMELKADPIETKNIESNFSHADKMASLNKSESLMHNKKQGLESSYYKQLGDIIKGYDEVLLFGPTDAKTELFNVLRSDLHFKEIKIDVLQADKMTENQEHAFVKAHFLNH